ncbi:hypothetical protein OSB04_020378 [Centaurea solstitialis]|uniref:Uncharacterized protein n=1 Tax=Centaurea solstitialis TaxID=347529 RepID=A0AA38WD78_9ASTR|nr:hypothetical protein OSB04_020378 [Centaurea solstitialis]
MERVESGRDLRAKMFEKLSKENGVDGPGEGPNPDVGWISELIIQIVVQSDSSSNRISKDQHKVDPMVNSTMSHPFNTSTSHVKKEEKSNKEPFDPMVIKNSLANQNLFIVCSSWHFDKEMMCMFDNWWGLYNFDLEVYLRHLGFPRNEAECELSLEHLVISLSGSFGTRCLPESVTNNMCQHMTHDTYAYDVAMAYQSATRVNELLRARHFNASLKIVLGFLPVNQIYENAAMRSGGVGWHARLGAEQAPVARGTNSGGLEALLYRVFGLEGSGTNKEVDTNTKQWCFWWNGGGGRAADVVGRGGSGDVGGGERAAESPEVMGMREGEGGVRRW